MAGDGKGYAYAALGVGVLFVWSAVNGRSVLTTLKDILQGKKPTPGKVHAPLLSSGVVQVGGGNTGLPYGTAGAGPRQSGVGQVSPLTVYKALRHAGMPRSPAIMLTAVCGVESTYNTTAWNQTAATGDDSVGLFQINYYDGLYPGRVALTGMTPEQMHVAGVQAQADAAFKLWAQSGLQPWGPDIYLHKVDVWLPGAYAAANAAGF